MERMEFVTYDIKNFSPKEIENTGAKLKDIKADTILCLQRLRTLISRKIILLKNGLTTGIHTAKEHPEGRAVDVFIGGVGIDCSIIYHALQAGFRGIGFYYCSETDLYSFHFDLGEIRFWGAAKNKKDEPWKYFTLLKDPKEYL